MKHSEKITLSRRTFLGGLSAVAIQLACAEIPLHAEASGEPPTTETEYGKIRGRMLGKAIGFLGVPYGGPTEGAGRFLPPSRPSPWSETRDCTAAGPRAMQSPGSIFTDHVLGPYFSGGRSDAAALTNQPDSENCLDLNVLTPNLAGKRPVMVYIHGGGFSSGSGALTILSDRFVSEEDVVVVGINHRLNVFGYLYLGDLNPDYPDSGNIGQLDLVAALKWVKKNIAYFGGDPDNVTIYGESGGGGKIGTLLAMPTAKGLFHRAIIESGSILKVATRSEATQRTVGVLAALGLSHTQTSELQKIPAHKLLAAGRNFGSPVVDGRSVPHQIWKPGPPPEAAGIPLLVGNCTDETTLFTLDPAVFSLDWDSLKAREASSGIPVEIVDKLIQLYRKSYPTASASDIYFRMAGDKGLRQNAIAQAEEQLRQARGHVYMYHFEWNTPVEDGKVRAFHTAELPLAMRLVCYPQSENLSREIAGAWAAFARSGKPTRAGLVQWDPYTLEKRATMIFDVNNTRLVDNPSQAELQLLKPYQGALF